MPPIDATEAQRKARLNPTSGALQLPGGIFFDKEDPYKTTVYQKQPSGSYVAYDLGNLAREIAGSGTVDAQTGLGGQYKNPYEMGRALLAQQGVDLNQIPNTAFIDAGSLRRSGSVANGSFSQLKSALVAPPVASGTQAINTTPNTLATPLANTATVSPATPQNNAIAGGGVQTNPLWLQKGETLDQYFARTNALNPNYADKITTPSTPSTITSAITGGAGNPLNFQTSSNNSSNDAYVAGQNAAKSAIETAKEQVNKLGATEQQQSDEIKALREKNLQLLGKEAYQAEQEKLQGIDEIQKTKDEYTAQLKELDIAQAQAQLAKQQGEGVTTAIDQRQRSEALRQNALDTLAISAKIAAVDGRLATAQRLADKAVKAKYGGIEEEIKVRTANLNLIKNDPQATLEEKTRADALLTINEQAKNALAQQKVEETAVWSVLTTAAQNQNSFTPTPQYPTLTQALDAIQNAPTKEQALAIASATGLTKQPTALSDYEQAFLRDKGRLPTLAELSAYNASQRTTYNVETPTKSGTLVYTAKDKTEDSAILEKSRGADGYANSAVYKQLYDAWIKGGGNITDFVKEYPPKNYINPADKSLPPALQNKQADDIWNTL